MKVLLVDDDALVANLLGTILTANRWVMDIATDGEMGLEMLEQWEYDVILLDVALPKLDGVSVCRRLRQQGCTTPVLMLTAQSNTEVVVAGLDAGADDYVVKPFDPVQVFARLRALQRRSTQELADPTLHWGVLALNPVLLRVTYHDREIACAPKEYTLLELLLRNPQRTFSRGVILDQLWGAIEAPSEAAVTNLVKDLRHRLKAAGVEQDPIETLHGRGYRLRPLPSVPEPSQPNGRGIAPNPIPSLQHVIEKFQESVHQRLADIQAAETALHQGNLTPEVQQQARRTAHQLVGSLGSYGYPEGSDVMRTVEHLLAGTVPLADNAAEQLTQILSQLRSILSQAPSFDQPRTQSPADQTVLIIDADAQFTKTLEQAYGQWPLNLLIASELSTALHRLAQHSPDAVVLNLGKTAPRTETLAFLAELTADFPQLPVIVLADCDRIEDRTAVAPYGIRHFVVKPIATADLLALLTQLITSKTGTAIALVVDDDPMVLKILTEVLRPQGLQTRCLTDPSQFWQVLKAVNPTLLLLDLEMPNYNGIELCQTVRQDVQYGNLPILVVTAHVDSVSLQQAIAAGADDVIPKPISEDVLLNRISRLLARRHTVS